MECPYGGKCVDPGSPSDCQINGDCVSFSSTEERQAFDALPDQYYFRYPGGREVRFKNKNQLRFLLTDLPDDLRLGAEWGIIGSQQNPMEFD